MNHSIPMRVDAGEIRTHGGPSIAHDGTQVSLVMSPIDQTLAQLPTRLETVYPTSKKPQLATCGWQSPCVLVVGVGLVLMGSPFSRTAQTWPCTRRVPLSVVLVHQHGWGFGTYILNFPIQATKPPCVLAVHQKNGIYTDPIRKNT